MLREPAVELIWWDHETGRYRWTYRGPGVHHAGEAWTWELAEQALICARSQRTPRLPVRLPLGRVDRPRYRLGRGRETERWTSSRPLTPPPARPVIVPA